MKIYMSSIAFRNEGWRKKLMECREFAEKSGWEFGIQLHNTVSVEQIEELSREKIALSAHAPLLQDRNWNLAAENTESVFCSIEENFGLFDKYGIRDAVFHGALMSDVIPEAFGHGQSYQECMAEIYRPELAMFPDLPLNRDFTDNPEYVERLARVRDNLRLIRKNRPQITLCLENDYPAYGSMDMFFREMGTLDYPLYLDTGHLWMSAHIFDRDFHPEIKTEFYSV